MTQLLALALRAADAEDSVAVDGGSGPGRVLVSDLQLAAMAGLAYEAVTTLKTVSLAITTSPVKLTGWDDALVVPATDWLEANVGSSQIDVALAGIYEVELSITLVLTSGTNPGVLVDLVDAGTPLPGTLRSVTVGTSARTVHSRTIVELADNATVYAQVADASGGNTITGISGCLTVRRVA